MEEKISYSQSIIVTNEVVGFLGRKIIRKRLCRQLIDNLPDEELDKLFYLTEEPVLTDFRDPEAGHGHPEQTKFIARVKL